MKIGVLADTHIPDLRRSLPASETRSSTIWVSRFAASRT
jgi:predicted phosphodiesterase